jgi:hypothetical protein
MRLLIILVIVIAIQSCQKEIKKKYIPRKFSSTLTHLDKYNTEKVIIFGTPTYFKYKDDSLVQTELIERMDLKNLITTEKKVDSIRYLFKKDSLIIFRLFFNTMTYDYLTKCTRTDSSLVFSTAEVALVDTVNFDSATGPVYLDVSIAFPAELRTTMVLNKEDLNKTIYYNNKKIK